MAESTVKVNFLGDTSKLKGSLDDVDGAVGKAEGGFGKLGAAIGGAVAVGGAVSFAKGAFEAAMESQKIAAQTEAVIKSTGGAAQLTADQIGNMAGALSMKNGVDDEAIQKGQNLLLTFTNIQDRAGKGNDIFSQSSQIMIDMAAAMGTDVAGGAIQLGKALNDPVAGISALSRVGVTFDDQQKKQIKTMQEHGDMAGAQKVILAELTKEFGGSAAAQATAGDRLKIVFGNIQEAIGAKLIPVVEKAATGISNFIGGFTDQLDPSSSKMANFGAIVRMVFETKVLPVLRTLRDVAAEVFGWLSDNIPPVLEAIRGAMQVAFAWMSENLPPVLEGIRSVAETVFNWLRDNVPPALARISDFVRDEVVPRLERLANFVRDELLPRFQSLAQWMLENLVPALQKLAKFIIEEVLPPLGKLASFIIDEVIPVLARIAAFIVDNVLPVIARIAEFVLDKVIPALGKIISIIIDDVIPAIGKFIDKFKDITTTLAGWVLDVWSFGGQVLDFFRELPGKIGEFFEGVGETISAPFRAAFRAVKDLWNSTVGGFGFTVPDFIPGVGGKGFHIPMMALGGIVTGPTLALIGEAGPEAVVPLSKMGGMGNVVNLTINVSAPDRSTGDYAAAAVAASVRRELAVSLRGAVA